MERLGNIIFFLVFNSELTYWTLGGIEMGKPLEIDELWSKRISQSLNGLEYGAVQIIVHDGRIVQIERMERSRFDQEARATQQEITQTKKVKSTEKRFHN
jgi:hypothetical protein